MPIPNEGRWERAEQHDGYRIGRIVDPHTGRARRRRWWWQSGEASGIVHTPEQAHERARQRVAEERWLDSILTA